MLCVNSCNVAVSHKAVSQAGGARLCHTNTEKLENAVFAEEVLALRDPSSWTTIQNIHKCKNVSDMFQKYI